MYAGHSSRGAALTRLVLSAFPFHAGLMAAGERLTAPVGLTSARWQVLSQACRADPPETVSGVARAMGLTRQAVQRLANELAAAGFLAFENNPQHKRAALLVPTDRGRSAFAAMLERQVPWVNALSADMDEGEIIRAAAVIERLTELFEARCGEGQAD